MVFPVGVTSCVSGADAEFLVTFIFTVWDCDVELTEDNIVLMFVVVVLLFVVFESDDGDCFSDEKYAVRSVVIPTVVEPTVMVNDISSGSWVLESGKSRCCEISSSE